MSNSNKLVLYTIDDCPFCDMMKDKLKEWNIDYFEMNITVNKSIRKILKDQGYKTVPLLYYGAKVINKGIDTADFTKAHIDEYI